MICIKRFCHLTSRVRPLRINAGTVDVLRTYCSLKAPPIEILKSPDNMLANYIEEPSHFQNLEIDWNEEMKNLIREEELSSPLDIVENTSDIEVAVPLPPSFNLAAYVNKSPTLQKMMELGVDLSQIERRKGLGKFLLSLDYKRDMEAHLNFLTQEVGVSPEVLGWYLTKNPLIFKEDLGDLETRVNYMLSKQFPANKVAHIVQKNPFWLMFSTQRIDRRLGFFQKEFSLNGSELRTVAFKKPQLITYRLDLIRQVTFSMREEMGMEKRDVKKLLLNEPKIWLKNRHILMERYDYATRIMKLTNENILRTPEVLFCRLFRLRQRHGFLFTLGKAQYDPKMDLYVSPRDLVMGTDNEFVLNVANSTFKKYDDFLRTL